MKLFLIHCGFYDASVCDGMYESHVNLFVIAETHESARANVKLKEEFKAKKMHIDGVQEIVSVDGYAICPRYLTDLEGKTILVTQRFRELAPKKENE